MTRSTTKTGKKSLTLVCGAAAVVAGVLLLAVAGTLSNSSAQFEDQGQAQQQEQQRQPANSTGQNGTATAVAAGGGGPESVVTWFNPQNVTINAGQTVVWTNPTMVAEPHTVSFVRQEDYFANLESPYLIPDGTELTPANPTEKNTEPLIITTQNGSSATNSIMVANNRANSPVVIDAQNNVIYLPPTANTNYTMTGNELFVNSGVLWPEGQTPPGAPPITTFSVTFEKAGTYDYLCLLHPWMTGQVVVQ
jgi:plastocyanin